MQNAAIWGTAYEFVNFTGIIRVFQQGINMFAFCQK